MMQVSAEQGMRTMDDAIELLVESGVVSEEEAQGRLRTAAPGRVQPRGAALLSVDEHPGPE